LSEEKKQRSLFTKCFNVLVFVVMLSMVLMIFLNASARYLFNTGWPISEELSRFAFVWVSVLGSILAYNENKHVGVDVLINALHGLPRLIVLLIGDAVVLTILGLLLVGSWRYFLATALLKSPASGIPMGVITVTSLVLAAAMLVRTTFVGLGHIAGYRSGKTAENRETAP
jgi:TRAP-type C4-dicarboxylate transport system permease small subunit